MTRDDSAANALLLDLTTPLPAFDRAGMRAWGAHQRIFISSTMRDLGPEREAAVNVVREVSATPRFFEGFSADADPGELYRSEVGRCTVYVLILGERYGTPHPRDPQRRSATHIEYEEARAHFKPTLVYRKRGVQPEPELARWMTELEARHVVTRFTTPAELTVSLDEGLRHLAQAQSTEWVKLGRAVFPVRTYSRGARQTHNFGGRGSTPITLRAGLSDRGILQYLQGQHYQDLPLTFDLNTYAARDLRVQEEGTGAYQREHVITLSAHDAEDRAVAIMRIANSDVTPRQMLESALHHMLFESPLPQNERFGFAMPFHPPVVPELRDLHRRLAHDERSAELFPPLAKLFLTDRLLRGSSQHPALLSSITRLTVSPAIDQRVQVYLAGQLSNNMVGEPLNIVIEGEVNLFGPPSPLLRDWNQR